MSMTETKWKLASANLWIGLFMCAAWFALLSTIVLGPIGPDEYYKVLPMLFALVMGLIMIWQLEKDE